MEYDKEEEEKDAVVFLDRSSRATRGKRMSKLVDDQVEEDDEFWNQDALKEEEDDTNYVEEGDAADVFDSDFDEDEPEPEEEADNEPDDRKRPRKKLVYPGKPKSTFPVKQRLAFPGKQLPKKKKQKVASEPESSNEEEEETNPEQSKSTPQEDNDYVPDETEAEKTTRKSTRTSVVVRQAEREAIHASLQATMKPIKRKKGEEKRMTQEEMLLEAAQTEIMNLRNLERVLAREEEVKKRAIVHKAVFTGPQIRYLSKDGYSYLEFTNGVSFQSQLPTSSSPYPEKAVCVVTGLPAKYVDPKTGMPYATKEAFKIIREKHSNDNSGIKEKTSMGKLYDLTCGEGFTKKKMRSVNRNRKENFNSRFLPRLRQISVSESDSESEDSE